MAKTRRSLPKQAGCYETGAVRLSESEVRSIFACVQENKPPGDKRSPSTLPFKIIKTQNNKPMLSPPPLEFEGGCLFIIVPSHYMCSVVFSRCMGTVVAGPICGDADAMLNPFLLSLFSSCHRWHFCASQQCCCSVSIGAFGLLVSEEYWQGLIQLL